MKRYIPVLILPVLAIVVIVLTIVPRDSKIVVDVSSEDSLSVVAVFVDDDISLHRNENDMTFTVVAPGRGEKEVTVRRAGYVDYTESVSLRSGETSLVQPLFTEKIAPDSLATSLDAGEGTDDFVVENAQFFKDSRWLAYNLVAPNQSEKRVLIAQFNYLVGEWQIINYGDENELPFDTTTLEIPKEILNEYF